MFWSHFGVSPKQIRFLCANLEFCLIFRIFLFSFLFQALFSLGWIPYVWVARPCLDGSSMYEWFLIYGNFLWLIGRGRYLSLFQLSAL